MRSDNRLPADLRPFTLTPHVNIHAEGSVLVEAGKTRVLCTASVEERVPPFLRGAGKGWVTAEYGMLPRATTTRTQREATAGKVGGRTQEIQRLIGRSLRSVVRLDALGERTVWLDCDVLQADGGTPMLDLAYEEDSRAEVDMNVVQTGDGRYIEVQGTAETQPFDRAALDALLGLAAAGIAQLVAQQRAVVGHLLER